MAKETPPEFKFNDDDQEPEVFYHEEIKDLRVEKLSQRVTLISILLPCLIGVAIYFGYRDITGRLTQGQDTGYLEVQKLSRDLDDLSKKFNQKVRTPNHERGAWLSVCRKKYHVLLYPTLTPHPNLVQYSWYKSQQHSDAIE